MKKSYLILLIITLCFGLVACKDSVEMPEKNPVKTEQNTTVPAGTVDPEPTTDPFEFESEIDFSDFVTEGEELENTEIPSEPVQTEPAVVPTEPEVKPTDPTEPTEPEVTEPDVTEPEETTPAPTTPSIGADGYNNQIVRP